MLLPVYRIKCEGCSQSFDWSPKQNEAEQPPNYHSKSCQNRKRKRQKERMPTKCPHQWKKAYPSHVAAQAACTAMQDAYLKPYRCRCGAFHVGHVQMRIVDWMEK